MDCIKSHLHINVIPTSNFVILLVDNITLHLINNIYESMIGINTWQYFQILLLVKLTYKLLFTT